MKHLIVSIAIISGLIVFSLAVGCKESGLDEDVQTVQNDSPTTKNNPSGSVPQTKPVAEAKPAVGTKLNELKFVDNKPMEIKPATEAESKADVKLPENKPVAETNSAEEKTVIEGNLVAETKPVAINHAINKTVETKPVARTKPEDKLVPTAVPVVTAEEAIKMNEDATASALEKREPFFKFYQDTKLESVCFQGTIRATSSIPDPEKNDYDNCLYALFVEIDALLSDITPDTKIACEAIVNVPIMKNKMILQDNMFLPGDKIWCTCSEYDTMPQSIQEIQLSDDIQSYEHQQYFSIEIRKISSFQKKGNRNFAKREITILPIQMLPREENAVTLRKERIQNEISRIEEEIKKHGGSFEKWREEYKPIAEKYKQLSSQKYKGWINDSFFAAGGAESKYDTQEYIDGILPYKQYLEENNIDLIVLSVPSKWDFARSVLASEDFQYNPSWIEHYYECLKHDIEIIDPQFTMWQHRFEFPLFYFYNVDDYHPFEGYSFISAKVLADVLKRYSFPTVDQPIELQDYTIKDKQARYYWPAGNEKFDPNENVSFKRVIKNGKPIGNLVINSGSPFLFVSNSFFFFPLRSQGASVPGYTAYFLQHIPDWSYQEGVGNPMLRNIVSDSSALSNRKAVIMIGHPSNWNGSFPILPRYITDNAKSIVLEQSLDFMSSDVTIIDDGSFVFTKDHDGTLFAHNTEKENASTSFEAEIIIPGNKEKNICMLRINFEKCSYCEIIVRDSGTKETIDNIKLFPETNLHTDFFIPISINPRKILIEIRTSTHGEFLIKNLELWYY